MRFKLWLEAESVDVNYFVNVLNHAFESHFGEKPIDLIRVIADKFNERYDTNLKWGSIGEDENKKIIKSIEEMNNSGNIRQFFEILETYINSPIQRAFLKFFEKYERKTVPLLISSIQQHMDQFVYFLCEHVGIPYPKNISLRVLPHYQMGFDPQQFDKLTELEKLVVYISETGEMPNKPLKELLKDLYLILFGTMYHQPYRYYQYYPGTDMKVNGNLQDLLGNIIDKIT